jgi:hypothetical protein
MYMTLKVVWLLQKIKFKIAVNNSEIYSLEPLLRMTVSNLMKALKKDGKNVKMDMLMPWLLADSLLETLIYLKEYKINGI